MSFYAKLLSHPFQALKNTLNHICDRKTLTKTALQQKSILFYAWQRNKMR